jgi:ABC-type phosphate/phosphonate transport system substrate-binding protein
MSNQNQSSHLNHRRAPSHRWLISWIWLLLSLFASAADQPDTTSQPEASLAQLIPTAEAPLHIGFSYTMFTGINMTDARNSIKALTASIAREIDIPAETDPLIYQNVDEAESVLNRRVLGAVSMTTSEFWLLRSKVNFDRFLVTTRNGSPTNAYLVLAREGGPVKNLADLRGKHLLVYNNPAMCIALVFLDVELAKRSLPSATAILGKISEFTKPAKVVLPVFFGQADACLITRYAYETMVELNPQVGHQLRIIATSPDYVTALFGFRADLPPALKEKSIQAFVGLRSSIFGKQTLAVFQSGEISELPPATIEPALALLDEHARICPEANVALMTILRGTSPTPRPGP